MRNRKLFTLDKFIYEALYNKKNGYYMNKDPFGKLGDFITSPNISILFSEMLAIWVISFWEHLDLPKKFNLIELGAGNGEMMHQMIKTFDRFPIFKKCCKINILEKSNFLKNIQKKKLNAYKVKWLKSLDEVSDIPSIFIANEFFDALPIKQFIKKKNKWYERNVLLNKKNHKEFKDILFDMNNFKKKIGLNISYKQKFIEFSPISLDYLNKISKKIRDNSGGILIIDYGDWDYDMKNTLRSISKHKFNDVLKNFGKSDITYNINFNLLKKIFRKFNLKICGTANQGTFLKNLGILQRADILSKKLPFSKKINIYYRVKKLINTQSMGKLFKVILATNKKLNFKTGFTS